MDYATTKEEWWQIVDRHWVKLKNIVLNCYPAQKGFPKGGYEVSNHPLMAPQIACNAVIREIQEGEKPISKISLDEYIEELRERKDPKLDEVFQSTWFGMPETGFIRQTPGFHIFCDLCSESYVLYEEEDK